MPNNPLIGLTTSGRGKDGRFKLPSEYVEAVRRAGGVPVLVPPAAPSADFWLDRFNGMIFTGGGDFDPARYGGQSHAAIAGVDAERDAFEFDLISKVLSRRMPVLAICRGMQILNVALGGDLHAHLADRSGARIQHIAEPLNPCRHSVDISPRSCLHSYIAADRIEVASRHHQGIDRLGKGLLAVAWAEDGLVEAVELENYPSLIAVQWHPELTAAKDPVGQRLFDAFVRMASAWPRANSASGC